MSENTPALPPKGIGSLQWRDLLKGVYYAAVGQVLYLVGFFFSSLLQEHPRLPTWVEWLPYIKAIAVTIGGYVVGKLGVNNVGQPLTKNKTTVHIATSTLADLKDKAAQADDIPTLPPLK